MTKKQKVYDGLSDVGACFAVRADKYICNQHGCRCHEGNASGMYHVHPDRSYPHQDDIKAFRNLDEIIQFIKASKESNAAYLGGDGVTASEVMSDFWCSLT